jgi:aspartate/methionine/tyrosine aminotransferase
MLKLDLPKYKTIESISSTSQEYISFSQGTVKISGTPALIKKHIQEKLEGDSLDYYQYVGGIYALRSKIADKLSKNHDVTIKPEQVIISHGSIGALTAICLTLLEAGDEVLVPAPFYPSYRNIILFSKATPVYVEGYIMEQNAWSFDVERVKQAATSKTKMIILSNPSNPSGVCLSKKEILELKHWCEQKRIYLVSDEVYDNYIYDGDFNSFTPHVCNSDLIIRTGSFSKDYAMSGWRVGYIVAPEAFASRLIAVQDGTLCCPSVIGQHAALFALEHEYLIAEQTNAVRRNRDIAWQLLQPLVEKGIYSFIKPQAGIFFFINTTCSDSEEMVMDILHVAKVALVPGKDFGASKHARSSIRLCFARQENILIEGIHRLLNYFS